MNDYRHSFASRLSIKTVMLASLLFLATMAIIAYRGGKIVEKRSIEYARQSLLLAIQDVQSILTGTENTAESISLSAVEYYRDGKVLDSTACFNLLEATMEGNSSILGCGFFFAPNKYRSSSKYAGIYVSRYKGVGEFVHEWDDDKSFAVDEWDYFSSDWYAVPGQTGKPMWKTPYYETMETYYQLITTYSVPMFDAAGDFVGVFAIDLSLNWLKDKLADLKPYPNSNVVLADSSLYFICNPIAEKPFDGSFYETPFIPGSDYTIDRSVSKEELVRMARNEEIVRVRDFGRSAFYVFDNMDNGWILCVSSLYSDVFSDMTALWTILLILTVVVLTLLFFLNKHMINKISKPVMDFANAARQIKDGRFDVPIPEVNTNDELTELGNALTFMQNSVTSYIADLKTTTAEKERLKSELDVARNIQNQMLCKNFPIMDRGGLFADSIPAREVGGDLYDFFVNGTDIYFILGDVSGKGVPAALLMAITIAAFRAAGKKDHPMDEIVSLINNTFCKSNEDMMFVTLVVGKIDSLTGRMDFCNAGHNPMVLVSRDGKASFIQAKRNVACGVMSDFPYEGESINLEHGSRLLIYSDGITEAENAVKDQYGESRLLEWAGSFGFGERKDSEVVGNLILSVHEFTAGAEQNDDMTIMSISL